jgi:hypothetical protein
MLLCSHKREFKQNMNVKNKFGIFTLNFRSPKIESKYSHSVEVMEKSSSRQGYVW